MINGVPLVYGDIFGEWTVKGLLSKDRNMKRTMWSCSCSCGVSKPVSESNLRRGLSKSCGHMHKLRPYEALYHVFIRNAKKKGQEVNLSYNEFVKFTEIERCEYCDASVVWTKHCLKNNTFRYNLDRKENSKGYTKQNCVVCCWFCNDVKGSRFTYAQMKEIGKLLNRWRQDDKSL
jgi:hypothetical protein